MIAKYITQMTLLLTVDILFSLWFVGHYQPQFDWWKLIDKGIIATLTIIFSIRFSVKMNGTKWKAIQLISVGFIYMILFNMILGKIWHNDWFYMSPNHQPDKYLLEVFQSGKQYTFLLAWIAFILSGLLRYFNSYQPKNKKS